MTTTTPSRPPVSEREQALELLQLFRRAAFPSFLRRLGTVRGVLAARNPDLVQDLEQELYLDTLAHARTVIELDRTARHARWFRLLERSFYHLRVQLQRQCDERTEPDGVAENPPPFVETPLPPRWRSLARRLQEGARWLGNGRLNLTVTAARLGVAERELRRFRTEVIEHLGFGHGYQRFWTNRLVEALVGIAADRLRDQGLVRLWGEERRVRPDPRGRLQRLRRLRALVACGGLERGLRGMLRRLTAPRAMRELPASAFLEAAARFAPVDPRVLLWTFEAHVVEGHLGAAAHALRRARWFDAPPVATALARARLAEARGRPDTARQVLLRARARLGRDPRLRAALEALDAPDAHRERGRP